jgi:hypothetical protein
LLANRHPVEAEPPVHAQPGREVTGRYLYVLASLRLNLRDERSNGVPGVLQLAMFPLALPLRVIPHVRHPGARCVELAILLRDVRHAQLALHVADSLLSDRVVNEVLPKAAIPQRGARNRRLRRRCRVHRLDPLDLARGRIPRAESGNHLV